MRSTGGRWREDAPHAMMGMSSPEWAAYLRDELGVAPVAVAGEAHRLPSRPVGRQRGGAGKATLGVKADRARFQMCRTALATEQLLRRRCGAVGMLERRQRRRINAALVLRH